MSAYHIHFVLFLTILCICRIIIADRDRLRAKLIKKDDTIRNYFSGNLVTTLSCYRLPVFSYVIDKEKNRICETETDDDNMTKCGAYAGLTMLLSVFRRFALPDIISYEIIRVIRFRNTRKGEYSGQSDMAALAGRPAGEELFFCMPRLPKARRYIHSNTRQKK